MNSFCRRRLGTAVGLAFGLSATAFAAEGSHLLATLEKPAVVTAKKNFSANGGAAVRTPRLIVTVVGYRPPQDGGAVQIIVKAQQQNGTEREVGRFGVTPDTAFTASDSSKSQQFGLRLPPDMATEQPIKLNIYVAASRGRGAGAQVEIGSAEIR
jgi:hypothetical protein